MCGDGANDCGALKAAHTGISLSNNESSAASPFTSKVQDIRCILDIIREGRAALVTSFTLFKFMALYSLTQFISLMILYSIDNNLTDVEFLYIDIFIIACCAFSLGHTPPYEGKLAPKPPPSSLISFAAITSLLCQTSVVTVFQLLSFFLVRKFDWFTRYEIPADESPASYENYAVFTISALQYVILTVAFHKGPPYVGYICSNHLLITCLFLISSSTLYLILAPSETIQEFLELKLPPEYSFRIVIVILGLINLILSLAIEIILCDYLLSSVFKRRLRGNSKWRKKKFAHIEQELTARSDWPVITCDVDLGCLESSDKCRNSAHIKSAYVAGSQTIPRRLPLMFNKSISSSVPNNINNSCNSSSDLKLNCVSSQTTIQSVYFTPTENFSYMFS